MAMKAWISRDRSLDYRRFVMQKMLIEKHFPCFKCRQSHRRLECEGCITPSEDCDTYRIAITYEQDRAPTVRIKYPQIKPSARIHMYNSGVLCLYFPPEDPWRPSDNIHEKIIPWTAEWLVFLRIGFCSAANGSVRKRDHRAASRARSKGSEMGVTERRGLFAEVRDPFFAFATSNRRARLGPENFTAAGI
jgi:hypothetical protein